jgi:hypothetical protein
MATAADATRRRLPHNEAFRGGMHGREFVRAPLACGHRRQWCVRRWHKSLIYRVKTAS